MGQLILTFHSVQIVNKISGNQATSFYATVDNSWIYEAVLCTVAHHLQNMNQ